MDENKLIKVMDYIRRFSEENGYTPSVREIGAYCGIKSTATVHSYIERQICCSASFGNKAGYRPLY